MANDSGWSNVAGAAVSAMGNYVGAVAANKKQWKNQQKAMDKQLQQNKELWDYQNAYNTPQEQMNRLRAAGLNPNLIYGSGAGGMGQAGPIDSPEVPYKKEVSPEMQNPMSNYLSARQADAQYDATRQSIEVMRSRAGLTDMQTALAGLKQIQEQARTKNSASLALSEERLARFTAYKAKQLLYNEQSKGELLDQNYELRQSAITGIKLDNTFKTYRNQLAKIGIYASDDPKLRLLIQGANRMGIDLGEMLASGAKDILNWLK